MNWVLKDYLGIFIAVYLDDVIIYIKRTIEQHLDHLRQVFQILKKAVLKIKLKQCHFCLPSLNFLGHIVGREEIQPDSEKISKIKNFPVLTHVIPHQSALGLFG